MEQPLLTTHDPHCCSCVRASRLSVVELEGRAMKSSQIGLVKETTRVPFIEKPCSLASFVITSSSRTKHHKTMSTPNRYGPTQLPPPESASVSSVSSFTANMSELWMRL
jgi:hypothetical protein